MSESVMIKEVKDGGVQTEVTSEEEFEHDLACRREMHDVLMHRANAVRLCATLADRTKPFVPGQRILQHEPYTTHNAQWQSNR